MMSSVCKHNQSQIWTWSSWFSSLWFLHRMVVIISTLNIGKVFHIKTFLLVEDAQEHEEFQAPRPERIILWAMCRQDNGIFSTKQWHIQHQQSGYFFNSGKKGYLYFNNWLSSSEIVPCVNIAKTENPILHRDILVFVGQYFTKNYLSQYFTHPWIKYRPQMSNCINR